MSFGEGNLRDENRRLRMENSALKEENMGLKELARDMHGLLTDVCDLGVCDECVLLGGGLPCHLGEMNKRMRELGVMPDGE